MASSNVKICNRALLRVGVTETIDSLNDPDPEARACDALFEDTRDLLLQRFPWSFAVKRAFLGKVGEWTSSSTNQRHESWEYVYSLPDDYLQAIKIWSGARQETMTARVEFAFEVIEGEGGRVLLCNLDSEDEEVELFYIAQVTDPTQWSPAFRDCLSWALAADLAMALPVKPDVAVRARAGYEAAFALATHLDGKGQHEKLPDTDLITERE